MNTKIVSTLILFSIAASQQALASSFNCSTEIDGSKLSAVVDVGPSVSRSQVTIDGTSVPSVGTCFEMQRPSTRYLRCSHQSGSLRIEIYPWVETVSGALKSMEVVVWRGAVARRGTFDCE